MHATAPRQGVLEVTCRADDAVFGQVFLQALGLVVGIVGLLPGGKRLTRDALVRRFPLSEDVMPPSLAFSGSKQLFF